MKTGGGEIPDANVRQVLEANMDPGTGAMPLETYIQLALYHPRVGYYLRPGSRVGHCSGTDFYTAASLGPVYAKLVLAAVEKQVGSSLEPFTFVEFGPESSSGILGNIASSPFRDTLLIRPGEDFDIPPKSVVFSNELFDAQPFRRFLRRNGRWLEAGVRFAGERLEGCELKPTAPLPGLPEAPEGYIIDWPSKAHSLLREICARDWQGLFIAFDYGLEKSVAFTERPQGTGRTYANHQLGDDLLANPGHTDITCHVIWDELAAVLAESGFSNVQLERQESFFMRHSTLAIGKILEQQPAGFSREKQTLMELLHPDNMGHKFQVLSASRGEV